MAIDLPRFSVQHSGRPSLILEAGVDYDSFPNVAEAWAKRLAFSVTEKIDGPAERLWRCEKDGRQFWLAYDDWSPELSLEPCDDEAAVEIRRIGIALGLPAPE